MDENTIFENQTPQSGEQQPSASNPWRPQQEQSNTAPQEPQVPKPLESPVSAGSFSPPLPPPPPQSSFLSLGNILKVVIGIVVVVLIFLLVFKFLPMFGKNKNGVTLTYFGLWEDSPTMQSVISGFEKENPNIKVEYQKQDIKQYREKLTTRVQNGSGPDIFRFHNSWYPMLKTILLPMPSSVITKQEITSNFYPVVQKDLVKNGAIYGVPLEIDTLSLYVNTEMFKAAGISPPTNWQDFIAASRQLTVQDESGKIKTAGAAIGTFDNVNHAPDILSLLFVQNGANMENLNLTPKQASDALNFYTSFAQGNGNVWDNTLDPSILMFAGGNLGMYFGYSWDYFVIRAANPNLSFDIVPVPTLPGQNQTIASYWVEGVSSKSRHQKEALLFMKYLAKKETEQKLFSEESKTRLFGEPYARVDLASSLQSNAAVYPFVSQGKNAVSSFFVDNTYDNGLNSQMNVYLGNAVRSVLNGTSADSAVDILSKGVTQVLSQYGK